MCVTSHPGEHWGSWRGLGGGLGKVLEGSWGGLGGDLRGVLKGS